MKKKPIEESKPVPSIDTIIRHQDVLFTRLQSDINTIAGGQSDLSRNINDIKVVLNEHKTCFDRIEEVVTENMKDVKELKTDVSQLKGDVVQLKAGQEELKADVSQLKGDVAQLKAGQEELKVNVNGIEGELSTVKMAVLDSGREIKKLRTGQEEIKQKLDTVTIDHEQRIQKLETVH